MFTTSKQTIREFTNVLLKLPEGVYYESCHLLSNASIGQHTRHIIELYQSLLNGYDDSEVCYDNRKRDKRIEQDVTFAIVLLQEILNNLQKPDKKLSISYELNGKNMRIESNYYREVMYNLEHTIHHQALIRIAVNQLCDFSLSASFGVAPSTIEYRKQCAQ